jgi:hypothetical protein
MVIDIKPLRPANAVSDSMTAAKGAKTNAPVSEPASNQGAHAASPDKQ